MKMKFVTYVFEEWEDRIKRDLLERMIDVEGNFALTDEFIYLPRSKSFSFMQNKNDALTILGIHVGLINKATGELKLFRFFELFPPEKKV